MNPVVILTFIPDKSSESGASYSPANDKQALNHLKRLTRQAAKGLSHT
jgi:hypothetical protein